MACGDTGQVSRGAFICRGKVQRKKVPGRVEGCKGSDQSSCQAFETVAREVRSSRYSSTPAKLAPGTAVNKRYPSSSQLSGEERSHYEHYKENVCIIRLALFFFWNTLCKGHDQQLIVTKSYLMEIFAHGLVADILYISVPVLSWHKIISANLKSQYFLLFSAHE